LDKNKKIVSATVEIDNREANKIELIKHDLGHALGLKHSKDKKSIMYTYKKY
jgi:predicted Zn-dependent protease